MRTLVDVPESSPETLNAMAKKVSRPELVREAILEFVKAHGKKNSGDGIAKLAGAWGRMSKMVLAYQLRLRAAWTIVESSLR